MAVEGCRHPPELGGAQSAVVGVVEEIDGVVPVDEPILEDRKEGDQGQRRYDAPPRGAQGVGATLAARTPVGCGQGLRMGTRSTWTRWGIALFDTNVSVRARCPGAEMCTV